MSHFRRLAQFVLTFSILFPLALSLTQPRSAAAQSGDGTKRQLNAQSGRISFIGAESGRALPAEKALGISSAFRPADPAMALAKRFGPEFGLKDPERDLIRVKTESPGNGRLKVRYQQSYQGIPVMGGELIVNTNENGDLYSINGEVSSNLSLLPSGQPTIDPEQATQTALQAVTKRYQKTSEAFIVSVPELWIFDESLLRTSTRPVELVWRMEVTSVDKSVPVRELVLVNAQRGNLSLHFNQVDTAWAVSGNSEANKATETSVTTQGSPVQAVTAIVRTYTAGNGTVLPGTLLCTQTAPGCTNGRDPHADKAHLYAMGTYNMYQIPEQSQSQ
jgi:Zn-dependent metalloprotease